MTGMTGSREKQVRHLQQGMLYANVIATLQ